MKEKNKNKEINIDEILQNLDQDSRQLTEAAKNEDNQENIVKTLSELKSSIDKILEKMESGVKSSVKLKLSKSDDEQEGGLGRVVEGVFNGESMVGGDGKRYNVPPNYASKSKLVEGDILKLTISKTGSFIYKQIGPIEREQLIADLAQDEETGDWYALKDGKKWRLIAASVTYFHGEPGDEVVILTPKNSKSNWAAVENIIKNN